MGRVGGEYGNPLYGFYPCLAKPLTYRKLKYKWLCGVYVAYRQRQGGSKNTYGELSAKTRELIRENTTFAYIMSSLPVYKIDADTLTALDELPSAADKAAALEAALTQELAEDGGGFQYRLLGQRLADLKKRRDASDVAMAERLHELEGITTEAVRSKQDPERLNLTGKGEYEMFTVLRGSAILSAEEGYVADCARKLIERLRENQLLTPGWSQSKGARMRVERTLLTESWNPAYNALGFNPDDAEPPFLKSAVEELAKMDANG